MNTTLPADLTDRAAPAEGPLSTVGAPRVLSIDIFRGLTIAVMIFVNELSSARGLPWWTYHAPGNVDVMTYVDMVYPFFLFIVGMSLPLSVAQRLKRDPSIAGVWLHVGLRSLGLIALGLILANASQADPARMGFSGAVWALLGLLSAALYLNVYPKSQQYAGLFRALRLVGLAGVILIYALYRRTGPGGQAAWIDGSYPEILGLIGYTYLAVAVLYIPTRRWRWAPAVWFTLLMLFNALSTARMVPLPGRLPLYFWPFDNGAMAAIVMAGVITSTIFLGQGSRPAARRAMARGVAFGVAMLIAGRLLTPLGISKIRATPTWSLYSIGAAALIFTLLYWICDVRRWTGWATLFRPAGSNTLLTYLLPDLWYFLTFALGWKFVETHYRTGAPAVVKTLIFTVVVLGIAALLTKAKVRLQL